MTSRDHELTEQLLHEEESAVLDFKRDQHAFASANDITETEPLTNIFSFTYSSRHPTAYILIGVLEC